MHSKRLIAKEPAKQVSLYCAGDYTAQAVSRLQASKEAHIDRRTCACAFVAVYLIIANY